MAPLMAPKTITPWTWTCLHHGERFKTVYIMSTSWEAFIGVGFGRGVGFIWVITYWLLTITQ